ncbi:hypothetical protein EDB84DRAFT_1580496 [Lactarius hengduanensis]|nr:hypothetical protein EDB84DRAFT_1580496 [Lactarius hengduanensis]
MSFVSASNMEIVTEQPGIASTLIDDVDKLISFVRRYNNSIPEYIRVARMYFFGTPIRRTGSGFRRATPGCIRLKLFSSRQENSDDAAIDDEIDVPLSPNGDLDLHRVKLWWGIRTCLPLEPFNWKVFHPRDRKTISGAAIHNLTYGRQNNMFLICKPSIRVSSLSLSPKATDEYKLEELGTWAHELKYQRRALADDPAWYFNRLVSLCALAWLVSLVPGTLDVLAAAALALVAVVRWARQLLMALPEHARTRSF